MTSTQARGLRVAELATAVGARPDTIRYHERAGLLPAPERTATDYRSYDAGALDRLRFIQRAQHLGLRLADIRTLLTVRDTGTCSCEPADDVLRRRLAEIDAEIARLTALRAEVAAMADALPTASCSPRGLAWLRAIKRLRTRYEHRADIHLGLLQLACALICHRRLPSF